MPILQALQSLQALQALQGLQALDSSANAAEGSAMGHLTARDGIVGPWQGAHVTPGRTFGQPENLRAWPDWCRQAVMTNEVLSRLVYGHDAEAADGPAVLVHLLHLEDQSGTAPCISSALLCRMSAPAPTDFEAQARLVFDYADLRVDRMTEITDQTGGTLAYFARLLPMIAARMPATMDLLALAQGVAMQVAQQCKHILALRRPDAVSAQIQPIIATPGHGTLPSGHATEAFAIAEVLRRLIPEEAAAPFLAKQLLQMAARIAVNRTVAGVHFPADSFAGAVLGMGVGDVIAARAIEANPVQPVRFAGAGIRSSDFYVSRIWTPEEGRQNFANEDQVITEFLPDRIFTDPSFILKQVWMDAVAEWRV